MIRNLPPELALCIRIAMAMLLALVAFGNAPSILAAPSLDINGVEDELELNIRLSVGNPPVEEGSRQLSRYIADLPEQSAIALNALGYYAADIDVDSEVVDGNTQITINVVANDPVLVDSIDIQLNGEAADDAAYRRVLNQLPITEGGVFVSGDYEAAKSALIDQAQDLGYFQFAFTTSEVRVSRRQLTADIKLIAESGPRYRFGDIFFEQDVFTLSFLNRWVPFELDMPYESSLIGELTQNLQDSGYFQRVRVIPQLDRRYGTTVPVLVDLTRKENNQVAVGLGFATDTRLRAKLTWDKPLINRRGHSAETELSVAREIQNISFSYRIPRRNEPLYNFWSIDYGLQNDTLSDTDSFLSTLSFQRVTRTSSEWIETLFLRWERELFTSSIGEDVTGDLLLPGFIYSRSRSKGSPFPESAQSASFQLLGGSDQALSSINFLKGVASVRYLKALNERHSLLAGAQYGAITASDFTRVPTSQRFFAGGDKSVRGFGFRELSPRTGGQAIGGRYLEVLNLEYNYRFLHNWSGAAFVDAGRAFNNFDEPYSVGAGVGIRWQSPVGPFRIDIATPISDNDEGGVRLHLSLGPEF